jgi:hypothetical protein
VILSTYTRGGGNLVLGDEDDWTSWTRSTYDASGTFLGSIDIDSAGPDGIPFTADDELGQRVVFTPGTGGGPDTTATYDSNGDLRSRRLAYRDTAGLIVRIVGDEPSGNDSGAEITDYTDFDNDANGLLLKSTFYSDPGPDHAWFTSDDMAVDVRELIRDANGDVLTNSWHHCDAPDSCWSWTWKYDTAH